MEDLTGQLDKSRPGPQLRTPPVGRLSTPGNASNATAWATWAAAPAPDLTAVSSRFSRRDILESILEPSKVISEQYQNLTITTLAGKTVTGRLVDETPGKIVLQPDPLSGERILVSARDIASRSVSKLSPMPANLADVLSADEILDLIAYLEASGQRQHRCTA